MNPLHILRDAWYFYRSHLFSIALLCIPLLSIEALTRFALNTWVFQEPSIGYEILIGLMFSPLYSGALILYLGSRSVGAYPDNRQLISRALQLWPLYALLTGLSAIMVMCGLMMLIVPGVLVMVRICFAEFLLVLRDRQPVEALRESWEMTQGRFWPLLQCMLIVLLPLWVITAWLFNPEGGLNPDAASALPVQILISFAQLFMSVVLFRFFMLIEAEKTSTGGE